MISSDHTSIVQNTVTVTNRDMATKGSSRSDRACTAISAVTSSEP